ncbi:hypothetical protein GW755_01065 [bacterium]|nr:hypothetical protein [bacterium]
MNVSDLYRVLLDYRPAFLSFLGTLAILFLFKKFVLFRLDVLAKKTKITFDDLVIDIVESANSLYLVVISLFVSSKFVDFNSTFSKVINYIAFAFLLFFAVSSLQKVVNYFIENLIKVRSKKYR